MTRQFDESLQRLSKIFYLFLKEEGIASLDETVCLLEILKTNMFQQSTLAEAWKESDRRLEQIKIGESTDVKKQ